MTKSCARSDEVQRDVVGIKIDCLVNLSTMTRMELKSFEKGKVSMKSIEMESQGRSGIGSGFRVPYGR